MSNSLVILRPISAHGTGGARLLLYPQHSELPPQRAGIGEGGFPDYGFFHEDG